MMPISSRLSIRCISLLVIMFINAPLIRSDGLGGSINEQGIAYYNALIDALLEKGMLFHDSFDLLNVDGSDGILCNSYAFPFLFINVKNNVSPLKRIEEFVDLHLTLVNSNTFF